MARLPHDSPPYADPRLAAVLRQHAGTVIAALAATPRWVDRFRRILAVHLDDQALSLPAVAWRLGMSLRTLQGRLDSDGTSWREEAGRLRYERATRLLREGMPWAAIAAQSGYSGMRAAVRRWNNSSANPSRVGPRFPATSSRASFGKVQWPASSSRSICAARAVPRSAADDSQGH